MRHTLIPYFVLMFMLVASALGYALQPAKLVENDTNKIDLEAMIPMAFGDWALDKSVIPLLASPDVQEKIDSIYNQVLSRTYINSNMQRVMVSIAYGSNQSDSMQIHKPEVCYPAQGFQIRRNNINDLLELDSKKLNVQRLIAYKGSRVEPITYWIRVGDVSDFRSFRLKLEKLKFGLSGKIPDGLLFRVSSLGKNEVLEYKTQDEFISALINVLGDDAKFQLIGENQ